MKIQRILPDPIRGQILLTDNLVTVTRPRQAVVHKIAETFRFRDGFQTQI